MEHSIFYVNFLRFIFNLYQQLYVNTDPTSRRQAVISTTEILNILYEQVCDLDSPDLMLFDDCLDCITSLTNPEFADCPVNSPLPSSAFSVPPQNEPSVSISQNLPQPFFDWILNSPVDPYPTEQSQNSSNWSTPVESTSPLDLSVTPLDLSTKTHTHSHSY